MKHPDYPGVTTFKDRYGKERYRFRNRSGWRVTIPGEPHTPAFDAAYQAAIEGQAVPQAKIVRHPRAALPHSLLDCWFRVRNLKSWWGALDPLTQDNYTHEIEELLDSKTNSGGKYGDGPVADLKPRHVRDIMEKLTPSRARILMTVLRQMMKEAILQEWIEYDPTYRHRLAEAQAIRTASRPGRRISAPSSRRAGRSARRRAPPTNWRAGSVRGGRTSRWCAGTSMVTKIIDGERVDGFLFVQHKGRNRKTPHSPSSIPLSAMLVEALAPLDRSTGETVLAKPDGTSLQHEVAVHDDEPRLGAGGRHPGGYTLHGLRKAMGGMLADAGATAVESRDLAWPRDLQGSGVLRPLPRPGQGRYERHAQGDPDGARKRRMTGLANFCQILPKFRISR